MRTEGWGEGDEGDEGRPDLASEVREDVGERRSCTNHGAVMLQLLNIQPTYVFFFPREVSYMVLDQVQIPLVLKVALFLNVVNV
jgi:hypothetical protein